MITINVLVAMISAVCITSVQTTGFVHWAEKNASSVPGRDRAEVYALECFDHFNNCMVNDIGMIGTTKDFKLCKQKWETK